MMALKKQSSPPLLLAVLALCAQMAAQAQAQAQEQLPPVTVNSRAGAPVGLSGFGNAPATRLPLQAQRIDAERLAQLGSQGLAALPMLDASVSDAYNALGYWPQLKVRGFDLDLRFNLRRDGLPIHGETALDLSAVAALELLKGASGAQAGTSSPAGLLNLVIKRPDAPRLDLSMNWEQSGTLGTRVDWARREGDLAWRVNASASRLDPWLRNAKGERRSLALATEWRTDSQGLLEAELEASHQSQPSQPGFSLLGERLPDPASLDLRRNLNDAAWRLPVVFDNRFASLRYTRQLGADWRLQLQAGQQRTRSDDRVAFPFGCDAEGNYDRYCSDGRFDLYDFRSENERRVTRSARAVLQGRLGAHRLQAEALGSRYRLTPQRQAYNYAGSGSVFGGGTSQAAPELTDENTLRRERSQELALTDRWSISPAFELFAGLRHTRLQRATARTDGSRATDYPQSLNTPWLGASWQVAEQLHLYANAGQGVESEVVPNRARYEAPGTALPALKSHQLEVGLKAGSERVDWSLAAFRIERPLWSDLGACDSQPASCRRVHDGSAEHQGLEAQADLKWLGGGLLASAQWLHARRRGAADAALNGQAPVNVPEHQLRLALRQQLAQGLQGQLQLIHEGPRGVTQDGALQLPSWTRWDAALRYDAGAWRWHLGVQNLGNAKAWKEAPLSFGHHYLFPLAPRQWQLGLDLSL